jgi:hypothetical protein
MMLEAAIASPLTLSLSLKGRGDAVAGVVRLAPLPLRERGWDEGYRRQGLLP